MDVALLLRQLFRLINGVFGIGWEFINWCKVVSRVVVWVWFSFFFTLRIEESETQLKFVKEKGSIYGKIRFVFLTPGENFVFYTYFLALKVGWIDVEWNSEHKIELWLVNNFVENCVCMVGNSKVSRIFVKPRMKFCETRNEMYRVLIRIRKLTSTKNLTGININFLLKNNLQIENTHSFCNNENWRIELPYIPWTESSPPIIT